MERKERIDFLDERWRTEDAHSERSFGINDGEPTAASQEGRRAYTTIDGNKNKWNAIVSNESERRLQFIPLDHNVTLDGLCDGLLYTTDDDSYLLFVELKSKAKEWIQEGINQLEKTIALCKDDDNLLKYNYRKAYLCNNRHPHFPHSQKEEMQRFKNETSFRLHIEQKIHIN